MEITRVTGVGSSHFSSLRIQPQFLVLHATGCDYQKTKEIFTSEAGVTAAHLVIDTDGKVYEFVPWRESVLMAHHVGKSVVQTPQGALSSLNAHSVGIELVNQACQWLPFSDVQYESLAQLIRLIAKYHPQIYSAENLLGHEEVAGFRGKIDPGIQFDWPRLGELLGFESLKNKRNILKLPERVSQLCQQVQSQQLAGIDYAQLSSQIESLTAQAVASGEEIFVNQERQVALARKFYPK